MPAPTQDKFKPPNPKLIHHLARKLCILFAFLTVYAVADTEPQDKNTSSQSSSSTAPEQGAPATTDDQPVSYEVLKKLADSGQREKAITLAEASLKKEENVDIRTLLGYLLLWKGDYNGAKHQFEIALKNSSNGYPDVSDGLARIEIHNDNYQAALNIVNSALKHDPTSKLLLDRKKQILNHLENKNKATTTETVTDHNKAANDEPASPEKDQKKLNALSIGYEYSRISDLDEIWQWGSIAYKRYTSFGPLVAKLNRAYEYQEYGTQYELEAYPHVADGFYLHLDYGYSSASFLPKNQYEYEGYFSLPHAFEFSIGENLLKFQSSVAQVYTGSLGKYIGNYWIAYRPYITTSGMTNTLTIRRYFSSADSYISVRGGYGTSGSDLTNSEDISSNRSKSISLDGQFPIKANTLLFNWKVSNSVDHFPTSTGRNRSETDLLAGLTWLF